MYARLLLLLLLLAEPFKGPFIATQLNSTELNSKSSCRHVHGVNNSHLSMNVVTQLTQFVGRDVIKTRLTWLYAVQLGQLRSVELS